MQSAIILSPAAEIPSHLVDDGAARATTCCQPQPATQLRGGGTACRGLSASYRQRRSSHRSSSPHHGLLPDAKGPRTHVRGPLSQLLTAERPGPPPEPAQPARARKRARSSRPRLASSPASRPSPRDGGRRSARACQRVGCARPPNRPSSRCPPPCRQGYPEP